VAANVAWFDRDQVLLSRYRTGVSIHSHTNRSKENLEFVERMLESHPLCRAFLYGQRNKAGRSGVAMQLSRGYWTPPLCPRSAYELEKNQIEQRLDMRALVSLSDHDGIEAPLLLQVVKGIAPPISVEWTVPFQSAKFHLGVHNLPAERAQEWMDELQACTAAATTERVCDLLNTLHAMPGVLLVFNHPLWNLYRLPEAIFAQEVEDFLALNNHCLHAFELNGLRRWEENRRVAALAARWQQILVSGGDRHGCEPNANLNLTNAESFDEWVHELRVERHSQLLFMPQYDHSLVVRCYQTFLDAVREYPEHPDGTVRWDQRTFHPGHNGDMRPLSTLWRDVPPFLKVIIGVAQLAETSQLLHTLRHYSARPARIMPELTGQEEGA